MEKTVWPIKPVHITNDGAKHPDLTALSGAGIITNEHLQGIQTSICANLGNPTTIVEFSPDGQVAARTDTVLLFHALRPACARFREATDHKHCHECDNEHASLFVGLTESNILDEVPKRIQENVYIQNYRHDPGIDFRFVDDGPRPYLEYDCPLLGYRELFFPIFFEGRVIAALSVGQTVLDHKLDFIPKRQAQFLSRVVIQEPIVADIKNEHNEWVSKRENILDEQTYHKQVGKVHGELESLEKTLHDQVELKRERYVHHHAGRLIREFQQGLNWPKFPATPGENGMHALWENLQACLEDLVETFSLEYTVVFGARHSTDVDKPLLRIVAQAGAVPACFEPTEYSEPVFDLAQLETDDVLPFMRAWEQNDILVQCIPACADDIIADGGSLSTYVMHSIANGAVVIFIGYHPDNPKESEENKPGGYLDSSITSFFAFVSAAFSSILAAAARSNTQMAFRVFGHEVGHLTSGLDWLRLRYLVNNDAIRNLPDGKIEDLKRDIEGYLRRLHYLTGSASYASRTEPLEPEKEYFYVFRELLFKWKDTYRQEAEHKSLQFYTPGNLSRDDIERSKVFGDLHLLEQVVYSLVSNAVKYSHRGTKICMDCTRDSGDEMAPHILTITNYGMEIVDTEDVYEIYYRGENMSGESHGLGIGLYVARQIARAHGGDVTHHCEKISDYNVPLIESFLKLATLSGELRAAFEHELERLNELDEYYNIVALESRHKLKYSEPSKHELTHMILEKTYKTVFSVTIPAKENGA